MCMHPYLVKAGYNYSLDLQEVLGVIYIASYKTAVSRVALSPGSLGERHVRGLTVKRFMVLSSLVPRPFRRERRASYTVFTHELDLLPLAQLG